MDRMAKIKCERRPPRGRRSLSPRPGRGGHPGLCPGVCSVTPRWAVGGAAGRTAVATHVRARNAGDDRAARAARPATAKRPLRPFAGFAALKCATEAAHPDGEVVLHDLADLRLAQELVGAKRVFDPCRRVRRPGGDQAEILRRVCVVAELAQTTGQLRGCAERGHAVTTDEA